MGNLKMRFKVNEIEFEIEGEEASVKQEFEKMKAFVLNELIPGQPSSNKKNASAASKPVSATAVTNTSLPAISEMVNTVQPKSESDWITLYGLYASGDQQQDFTVNDLRALYRSTGRANTQRVNNIRNNMKTLLNKSLLVAAGDDGFNLTSAGRKFAEQLLKGKQPSKFAASVKPVKRGRKPVSAPAASGKTLFKDMSLTGDQLASLINFFRAKKPRTQAESILVLIKWAQDKMNLETVSIDELRYMMDKTMKKIPSATGVLLTQMRGGEEPLLAAAGRGRLALSSTGNTIVDAQLPVKTISGKKAANVKNKTKA